MQRIWPNLLTGLAMLAVWAAVYWPTAWLSHRLAVAVRFPGSDGCWYLFRYSIPGLVAARAGRHLRRKP